MKAELIISETPEGILHFIVRGRDDNFDTLQRQLKYVFDRLRGTQKTFLRRALCVDTVVEFSSHKTAYEGGFRYSVYPEEGTIFVRPN